MIRIRCTAAAVLERGALALAVAAATARATAVMTARAAHSVRPPAPWALSDHPDVVDLDAAS